MLSFVAAVGAGLASPANAACQLMKYADLAVTMQGLRATVMGKVNGVDAKFVVDTGAFFSSMTKASATRLGLPVGAPPFGMGYLRGVGHVHRYRERFSAGGFDFAHQRRELIGAASGHAHLSAGLRQRKRSGASNALRRTRDQRNFIFQ